VPSSALLQRPEIDSISTCTSGSRCGVTQPLAGR
jgi:hypothetical protein